MPNEPIPGLRQPTELERTAIAKAWGDEIQHHTHQASGKLLRFFAIFLIVCSAASAVRNGQLGGSVVTFVFGVICYFFSTAMKKSGGNKKRRLQALYTGNYMVAEAQSTQISYVYLKRHKMGRVAVRLSNGRNLPGSYRMPYSEAEPYINLNQHSIPVLLIILPGEETIWTIPSKK